MDIKKLCLIIPCFALTVHGGESTTPVTWANADPGDRNDVTLSGQHWGLVDNWRMADGSIPSVAPTNAADRYAVTFGELPDATPRKFVNTGTVSGAEAAPTLDAATDAVDPSVYSVTGSDRYEITHTHASITGFKCQRLRTFAVTDPNGFLGWWSALDVLACFRLDSAKPGFEPVLSALSAQNRPTVEVSAPATTAHVATVHGGGAVSKTGPGTLRVESSAADSTVFYAEEGTLSFAGHDEAEVADLLSSAALHLDASVAATLTYTNYPGQGARNFIRTWGDVRGTGAFAGPIAATAASNPDFHAYHLTPFISPETSPTGLPLVDFGSNADDGGTLGPSNCVMGLSTPLENVREAFYAGWTPHGGTTAVLFGGRYGDGAMIDYVPYTWLFCEWAGQPAGMYLSEIFLNCENRLNREIHVGSLRDFYTCSMASAADGRIYMLGSDRGFHYRAGGVRVGEILLFTNVLTRAQRVAVNRYLDAKWRTGSSAVRQGSAVVVSSGAALDVPAGKQASVGAVHVKDGKLVKTGDGVLKVDQLTPNGLRLDVRGGSVRIGEGCEATASAADAPYLHLDASSANAFEEVTSETYPGVRFVTAWRDCRAGAELSATGSGEGIPRLPTVLAGDCNGKDALSFGVPDSGWQSWMRLPNWGQATAYAGFVVMRPLSTNVRANIFGSSDMTFTRDSTDCILNPAYRSGRAVSARYCVNGVPKDPWVANESSEITDVTRYAVYSFDSPVAQPFFGLATDREFINGGWAIAEVLVYDRRLTMEEVTRTQAYLMRKWLGREHPSAERQVVSEMAFREGTPQTVDTDGMLTVGALVGGTGDLVKKGGGTATVTTRDFFSTKSVAVDGGTLDFAPEVFADAAFHFDASDPNSMIVRTGTDATGNTVTNVVRMNSVNGNGVYVHSFYDCQWYPEVIKAHPTLHPVETRDGVVRMAVDFGHRRNSVAGPETAVDTAAMRIGSDSVSGVWYDVDNVRETFVVTKNRDEGCYNNILGSFTGNLVPGVWSPNDGNYIRQDWDGVLVWSDYGYPGFHAGERGYLKVDGVEQPANSYKFTTSEGFRLLELMPGGDTRVGALAMDRPYNGGGCLICEVVSFSRELSEAERGYLRATLMEKWFADGSKWTKPLGAVSVAASACLAVGSTTALSTPSLSGSGMITCGRVDLSDGGELSLALDGLDTEKRLTVDGMLNFAGGATVRLSVRNSKALVSGGEYELLRTTGGISGFSSAVQLAVPSEVRCKLTLFTRGDSLWVKVDKPGFVILVM